MKLIANFRRFHIIMITKKIDGTSKATFYVGKGGFKHNKCEKHIIFSRKNA